MDKYYVHTKKTKDGYYEIHCYNCWLIPEKKELEYLGEFDNCRGALEKARESYYPVHGCAWCSIECNRYALNL